MIDSSLRTAFNGMSEPEIGPRIQMKVLIADEEERTSLRQNSAEVHSRSLLGDGQGATGPKAALLGAGIVIAGSPHLKNDHVRV